MLGNQNLECHGNVKNEIFGHPTARNCDGVYLRGEKAVQYYTKSFLDVLLTVLSEPP